MTQKKNRRPLSGKTHPLHIQRKPGKPSQNSRTCFSSVLTVMALFIMNLSFQAKWLSNIPLRDFAVIEGASPLETYGMRRNLDWLFHHDRVLAHTALSVQKFLATNNMAVVFHPCHSPDLNPVISSSF